MVSIGFRKGKTKIGSSYNDWVNVTRGISQVSFIGHPFFNVFISEVFLFIEKFDICNFADDNTLLSCGDDLSVILSMKF